MNDNIRIAFIGAGNMAREHARVFSDIHGVELSGIYSRTKLKAEELASQFSIGKTCNSIDNLYAMTKAQLVVIAVPELETRMVSLEAFQFPWKCLIEKPVGYNLDEAKTILESSRKMHATAYVALNRRHYGSTRGVLEGLEYIDGRRLIHVLDQENPIVALEGGQPEKVVANWMYANSIHLVDYFKIFGRGHILAVDPIIPWNADLPEFVSAKITFSSGDIGLYDAIWNGPGPWAVSVTTQKRRWEIRPLERAAVQEYRSRKLVPIAEKEWDTKFKPGLRLQAEEAIRAVQNKPHSLPSLDDAMESMKLVNAIYA